MTRRAPSSSCPRPAIPTASPQRSTTGRLSIPRALRNGWKRPPPSGRRLAWKRNKKVAVKLLLPVLTVMHLGLCSPTHHWPSSLGFVRHDVRLHGSIASFSFFCVVHSSGPQCAIPPLGSYTFGWPDPVRRN